MKTAEKRRPEVTRLHNRLAVLRAERGMSRHDLAESLGVNYQTIGYLERGEYNPSLDLAFRIGDVFGVPIEAVFSRAPFPPLSSMLYTRNGASTPTSTEIVR